MDIICYSERILNPFRGVMNVIALDDAEQSPLTASTGRFTSAITSIPRILILKNSPISIIPIFVLVPGAKRAVWCGHRYCPATTIRKSSIKASVYSK